MRLTIGHLLDLIDELPKGSEFEYVKPGKNKAKLIEMPVELNFTRGESFGRIKFKDVWKMFTDTWKIWWNLKISKSYFK